MKTRFLKFEMIGKLMLVLFCTAFLIECDHDDTEPFSPYSNEDVYIAGAITANGYARAVYWKNDVPVVLLEGPRASLAYDIKVSNNDIYVVGHIKDENFMDKPALWKNGMLTQLSVTNPNGKAVALSLKGDTPYIAGYEENDSISKAKLWIGDFGLTLPTNSKFNSIYVDGNKVYIAGYEYAGTTKYAKYWIYESGGFSPTPNPLSTAQSFTLAQSNSSLCNALAITVKSGKVYVSGKDSNAQSVLWIDGEPTVLDPMLGASTSVFIKGNDIYTSGTSGDISTNKPWYWKNGNLTILDKGNAEEAFASSVITGKNNIYTSGYLRKNSNDWAVLWVNGVMKSLVPANERSWAYGIFLVEK